VSLTVLNAGEVLASLSDFDAVIDARSEAEYALDHLPGAVNWPTLDNEQRREIGTLYQQVNPFEARKRGAMLAARNIATHIERHVLDQARDWRPVAYCWRGGQRSGALALILGQIGFRVTQLEGGYKAFRAAMIKDIERLAPTLHFRVVCGPTGSGKTRLLQALAAQGAQVIDLEALARHRSSVLGALPGLEQPSQKRFDTSIWNSVRQFDARRPVYVESESKKVGNVAVPLPLMHAMRQSPCLNMQLSDEQRVSLLLEDYAYFSADPDGLCDRLEVLTPFRGRAVVCAWQALARQGDLASVVRDLLQTHYDPAYAQSIKRNFECFKKAKTIAPTDRSAAAMADLAAQLIACEEFVG
jgi:tRNA 2-selenouridine synthase